MRLGDPALHLEHEGPHVVGPPAGVGLDEVGVLGDTSAVPSRSPLAPAASTSRPAESPGGLVKTDPAFGPPGWFSRRQRTISARVASPAARSPGARARVASTTTVVGVRFERR